MMLTIKIKERLRTLIDTFLQRIRWRMLLFLVLPPILLGDLLSGTYFRQSIPIVNPITASTTSVIPSTLTISNNVVYFPSTYTWQTLFPSLIPFDFLNYSQLCVENHNESYFNGQLITDEEIAPNVRGNNAEFVISFAHIDGSSYKQFDVLNGNTTCDESDPHQPFQILVTMESIVGNNGQKVSEIKTNKSAMYLWPGPLNELFLIGILFLIWSAFLTYLSGLKNLLFDAS